jgi:hypothetical protein
VFFTGAMERSITVVGMRAQGFPLSAYSCIPLAYVTSPKHLLPANVITSNICMNKICTQLEQNIGEYAKGGET